MALKSEFGFEDLSEDLQTKLKCKVFKKMVKVTCHRPIAGLQMRSCVMNDGFGKYADCIRHFQVRDDDVWIISYPKCGTTWTQEMVWQLCNNLDFKTSYEVDLSERSPYLEMALHINFPEYESLLHPTMLDQMQTRRIIKTHLPMSLLPVSLWTSKARIVYVSRNPKDAAISYFHHYRGFKGYEGNLTDFLQAYLDGNLLFGSYFQHVKEFRQLAKKRPNVCVNYYEEMKSDIMGVLRKMSIFLEREYTEEQLEELEKHLQFDNMKKSKTMNMSEPTKLANLAQGRLTNDFVFMRKGEVGSFEKEMPAEFIKSFDEVAVPDKLKHKTP